MPIPAAPDAQRLSAGLRSLAGDTRAAVDALVAAWYLEFRSRTGGTFSEWHDPALREIVAALLFDADVRPGCARLGARRAVDGVDEAELCDDLRSLVRVTATDPTVAEPRLSELLGAALAGWHATADRPLHGLPARRTRPPDVVQLHRLLARLLSEDATPGPALVVVDLVKPTGMGHGGLDLGALLDAIEAAGPGPVGVGWFELVPGARCAAVTRRTRETARDVATLRGALRVAPELADVSTYVWIETVPTSVSSVPAFLQGLVGAPRRRHLPPRVARSRTRSHARPSRGAGRGRSAVRHPRWRAAPERRLAAAAALLLIVLAIGTLSVEPPVGPPVDDVRHPATGGTPETAAPAPETVVTPQPPSGGINGSAVAEPASRPPPAGETAAPTPIAIGPVPVAHVTPVPDEPPPSDDLSSPPVPPPPPPPPARAPPPEPEPDPAPAPDASDGRPAPSAPALPDHALAKVPDHARPASGAPPAVLE